MTDLPDVEIGDGYELLALTTEIVSAYASRNQMSQNELPDLIRRVHGTLNGLGGDEANAEVAAESEAPPTPAVPIKSSVKKDAITCLECGKSFKTLKRHLSTEHGMSPAEYKARWNLDRDYPLVAPSYSKRRADTAKKIGLGRKPSAE